MPKVLIPVELSDEDAAAIRALLERLNACGTNSSHGQLDLASLTGLLLEDAALAHRRPGSWEGANLATVLEAHGYTL